MRTRVIMALMLLQISTSAVAGPIPYRLQFDATEGSNGAGLFLWDEGASELTFLRWLFPDLGLAGFGGIAEVDNDRYIFAILTNDTDYLLREFGDPGGFVFFREFRLLGFPDDTAGFCAGAFTDSCRQEVNLGTAAYMFRDGDTFFSGSLRAFRVPEPSVLALFGLGLAALTFARRRRLN